MAAGKYVYSFTDDYFPSEEYDTPDEALKAARIEEKDIPNPLRHTDVYIGVVGEKWMPFIDGDGIIEMLQDEATGEGGDYGATYLENVPKEQSEELTEVLTEAFRKWAAKYGYEPNFYPVKDVKEYKL